MPDCPMTMTSPPLPGDEPVAQLLPGDDESLDALGNGALRIIQPKCGFRYTLDPLLLAAFAQVNMQERVLDLGTGNGVIPLLLANREPTLQVTGIEIDGPSAARARRSVRLNHLAEQIDIHHSDLRDLRKTMAAQSYDIIITNPPYRRPQNGRTAKGEGRAIARHELHGTLDDFLDITHYLLRNGGRFYVVHLAERLPELFTLMCARRIEPKRLRCIHAQPDQAALLVLVEGRRNGRPGLTIEPPLAIRSGGGYSQALREMIGNHEESGITPA